MTDAPPRDYSTVTEMTGNRLTPEAISMMYTRYRFGAAQARGRDVLEAACGVGQGLGLLAASARRVVGGDLTEELARRAANRYRGRVPVVRLDAQTLPFREGSFDVVLLYEAVYYLPNAARFVREAARVLRPAGKVILCSANPERSGFQPSPFSVTYYTPKTLAVLLDREGFAPEVFGAYPDAVRGPLGRAVSGIRRAAVGLGIMPRTMKGKEWLKRVFYGPLVEMPLELEDAAPLGAAPVPLCAEASEPIYKVFFAVGTRR